MPPGTRALWLAKCDLITHAHIVHKDTLEATDVALHGHAHCTFNVQLGAASSVSCKFPVDLSMLTYHAPPERAIDSNEQQHPNAADMLRVSVEERMADWRGTRSTKFRCASTCL